MGFTTEIMQFEGDTTQALNSFTWRTRENTYDNKLRMNYGVVLFEQGDLLAFEAAVQAYNDIIIANQNTLSSNRIIYENGPHEGFDIAARALAENLLIDPGSLPVYAGDLTLTLNTYVDGTLKNTKTIIGEQPFRIPDTGKGRLWEFEIIGNVEKVKRMDFASSMEEIKQILQEQQEGG